MQDIFRHPFHKLNFFQQMLYLIQILCLKKKKRKKSNFSFIFVNIYFNKSVRFYQNFKFEF